MERRRIVAWVLFALMALMLTVSSAYLVMAAGHCCVGHHCKTCDCASRAAAVLSGFVLFAVTLLLLAFSARRRQASVQETGARFACGSLVQWKVQLNN